MSENLPLITSVANRVNRLEIPQLTNSVAANEIDQPADIASVAADVGSLYMVTPTLIETFTDVATWATYDLSSVIPSNATSIMLEFYYRVDGDADIFEIDIQSRTDPSAVVTTRVVKFACGPRDTNGLSGQVRVPCGISSIDLSASKSGTGTWVLLSAEVSVIGYWA